MSFHSHTQRQALSRAYRTRQKDYDVSNSAIPLDEAYQTAIKHLHKLRSVAAKYEHRSLLPNFITTSMVNTHLAESTYAALLDDFNPNKAVGIFGADRITSPTLAHYSNVATCIRALLPLTAFPVPLLDHSILAVLALYYGLLHGNSDLVRLARSSYTTALAQYSRQLETAMPLSQSRVPAVFQVLVCASVAFQVFEYLDDIGVHSKGHLAHINGASSILQEVGPRVARNSEGMRKILVGFKGIVMYAAIERRSPSFLTGQDWSSLLHQGVESTMRDRLNTVGLRVPEYLQSTDRIIADLRAIFTPSKTTIDHSLQQLDETSSSQRELDEWLHDLEQSAECPLYWSSLAPAPSGATVSDDSECQPKYSNASHRLVFSCSAIAGLLTQFWCLQLELLVARIELSEAALRFCSEESPERQNLQMAWKQDRAKAEQVAELILQAEPRLSSCFEGLICIQAPLRSVVRYFDHSRIRSDEVSNAIEQSDD